MTRLIIFDFDGTLGDTRRNIVMTLQQTMQEHRLTVADEAACAATIGLTLENSFLTLYPKMTPDEAAACAVTYRRIFEVNKKKLVPQLFPHVGETLEALHRSGLTLSVASSRNSSSLVGFLHDMGIATLVSHVVGADTVDKPKPDPEPVLQTLAALGFAPDEAMVVGDMPVDIQMGINAGTLTCGVTYGNASRQQLEEARADFVINDMSQLLRLPPLHPYFAAEETASNA